MRKITPGYENWSELDLLTGMIYGEARGESTSGKIGVAVTAKNRVDNPGWWGRNWREVILMPRQFSCWEDHNAEKIRVAMQTKSSAWESCRKIAADVYLGSVIDTLGGPTHYHAISILPAWTSKMTLLAVIGSHIFYRDGGG